MLPGPREKDEAKIPSNQKLREEVDIKGLKDILQVVEKNPKELNKRNMRFVFMVCLAENNKKHGFIKKSHQEEIINNFRYYSSQIIFGTVCFSTILTLAIYRAVGYKRLWLCVPLGVLSGIITNKQVVWTLSPQVKRIQTITEEYIPFDDPKKSKIFVDFVSNKLIRP